VENQELDAQASLDALAATGAQNVRRLQRPRRYWVGVASLMTLFPLLPYAKYFTPLAVYLGVPAIILIIGIVARWRQPTAVRKIRLTGVMWLPVLGLAVLLGTVARLSNALFSTQGVLWLPAVTAAAVFTLVVLAGPAIDRSWARRVSRVG
jgi:hypothetical protein